MQQLDAYNVSQCGVISENILLELRVVRKKKIEITVRDSGRFVRVGIEYKSDKSSQADMYVCAKLFKNIQENYAERAGRANSLARLINVELKSRLTKC